ncbi:MAG: TonB-dependent receptor domain-containing protein [Bryobacteraceae bacterium]
MSIPRSRILLLCSLTFAGLFIANAQVTTTNIYGTVTDDSGAVVPNAQVSATNTGTNQSRVAQTNTEGQYRIEFLPVGDYVVTVSAAGFKKFVQKGIILEVNRPARVDAVLNVGDVSQTVSVSAEATLVNTNNAAIGRTVNNSEITELPIVGRNVYSLLTLTAGVDSSTNGIVLGYPQQITIINGGADGGVGSVNYYLDGGSNMTGLRNTGNIAPNPDAVQEFRVITNSYSAEYGRFASGVVNVITKSGTNALHGSLFEFLQNDVLNATTYGALSKAPLRRNQFGGTIGGPVRKDKTFFFGTYSGLRRVTTTFTNSAVVPTALERAGNFSQSKVAPIDPLTKKAFSGGIIPIGRFDPTALNILNKIIPLANSPGNVYQAQVPSPYDTDEFLAKVDHALTENHRLTMSYFETSGRNVVQPGGNLPWSVEQFTWRQHNANASDTWIISPNTVNQSWLTYTRNFGGRLNLPQTSLADFGSDFRVQGTPSLPQVTVSGYFTLAQAIAGPIAGTNFYSIRDVLSYTRGRHQWKFGGELSLNKDIQQTLLNNYGTFSFTGTQAGNALADFLLGLPVTMNQDAPVTALDNSWSTGLFVQDDFRILPRLTLNLGLRYDVQTPPTDPFDRELTFERGIQSKIVPAAPVGMLFPGDPGVTRGIVPARKLNFSPRAGFAWDPFGNGKTSIRGAAGIFYGSVSGNEWNSTSNLQPFAIRQQFNTVQSLTHPYAALPGGVSPFPYTYDPANPKFIFPASISGISPDYVWPYTYQLNFSIQRQLISDLDVTAAYVGSLSRRLPFAQDVNYPIYASTATSANVNNRRPILPGTLATITLVKSIMNAEYHGLQLTAEKRMYRHFGLKAFYTFGKSLEGAQLQNSTTSGGAQDFNNLSEERGRTDYDVRHRFVSSLIWQANYFGSVNPLLRAVINGWELSAIVTLQSGSPFTVTSGKDNNLDGTNNDRANLVGNPFLDPNRSRAATTAMWFNTAAFVTNPAGTDGTAGRNILDGPGSKNVDLGLFRNFRIRERFNLQARAEITNAFNLVNLSNPTSNLSSPLFGQIRTAQRAGSDSPMRQVQLGLRMTF